MEGNSEYNITQGAYAVCNRCRDKRIDVTEGLLNW